jgi:uncharacterized ParB-like nuclease family protein
MRSLDIEPQLMATLLPALSELDDSRVLGHVRSISVAKVMAWAWHPGRLERCKARLAAGERPPAIEVGRYWLQGESYYLVSDGHHRTVAAREAGCSRIRARIGSENWCRPEICWLDQTILWREHDHAEFGRVLKMAFNPVEPSLAEALTRVGVRKLER